MEIAPTIEWCADLSFTALAWMLWITFCTKKLASKKLSQNIVLMYLSGQRQVILSALFTIYHRILMMWGICQVTCTCSSP